MIRWRLLLEEYDYQIVYKPGKINCNADALSRIKIYDNAEIRNVEASEESYRDFLSKMEKSLIISDKLEESDESIFSKEDNYVICISQDLQSNQNSNSEILNRFDDNKYLKNQKNYQKSLK